MQELLQKQKTFYKNRKKYTLGRENGRFPGGADEISLRGQIYGHFPDEAMAELSSDGSGAAQSSSCRTGDNSPRHSTSTHRQENERFHGGATR